MFKSLFSFSGRIRRLEFGLTYILCFFTLALSSLLVDYNEFLDSIFALILILSYWVLFAQGAKRCHDIGHSGFYQLIPFYIFVMLFQEGVGKENKYGTDPKLKMSSKIRRTKFQKVSHLTVLELIVTSLFVALILSVNNTIFLEYESFTSLSYLLMPIPAFFIFLLLSYSKTQFPEKSKSLVNQQLIFAFIYYLIIRLYGIVFRLSDIDLETILFELFIIALIFGLTFISVGVFYLIFKPNTKNV